MDCSNSSIYTDAILVFLGGFTAGLFGYFANRLLIKHQRNIEEGDNKLKFKHKIKILLYELKSAIIVIEKLIELSQKDELREFEVKQINTEYWDSQKNVFFDKIEEPEIVTDLIYIYDLLDDINRESIENSTKCFEYIKQLQVQPFIKERYLVIEENLKKYL